MTAWAKPWNAPETVVEAPKVEEKPAVVAEPVAEEPKKVVKKAAETPAE